MAIRFQCPGCSQPIEIDDEWALKAVACPYCRRTITAPPESTLPEPGRVPVAKAMGGMAEEAEPAISDTQGEPGHPNGIAKIAFALSCATVVLFILAGVVLSPHRMELEELQKVMMKASSWMEASNKMLEACGGTVPTWLWLSMGLQFAAMGACLAALICGVIGVRRPRNRGLAVTALAISGGFVLVSCSGVQLL